MNDFQIESAQNVQIHQNAASAWDRILAFLIDLLIMIAYSIITYIILTQLDMDMKESWVFNIVLGLPIFLYHLVLENLRNGQSFGKSILKIRVVKKDGSSPSFSNYLTRWLLRIIDISLSSGAIATLCILLNGKGQRIGDIAAKTSVISEKKKISLHQTIHVDIPENYTPTYPQVRLFSDQDIQTIKDLFFDAKRRSNHQIMFTLSQKIATLMEVTPKEKPVTFIETVIFDYNYYTQN